MIPLPTEKSMEREQRLIFFRRLFRRVFLEDWGTKLIALGITAALWLGITGFRTSVSRTLKPIPLIIQLPPDMEITSNNRNQEIGVIVTGEKKFVDQLTGQVNARDLIATIDLTDVKSGDNALNLSPETVNIELPNGVKFVKVEPSIISVKVEKILEKQVAVKVETEGNVADGYEVYGTDVVPAKVQVRGAESFIKSLDSISTLKVNIDGLKENFAARQIGLNLVNPKITLLDTIVDVNFRIGEKRTERAFELAAKVESKTKKVSFALLGARSLVEKIQAADLKVQIIKDSAGVETPLITLPENLQGKVEILRAKINP